MYDITLKDAAEVIGYDNVEKLIRTFPGGRIYLKSILTDVSTRNKDILNDYHSNGLDRAEIAVKYGLSLSTVNHIISEAPKRKI